MLANDLADLMLGNQVKIAPIVDQLIAPLSPVDLARIEKICATLTHLGCFASKK